MVFQRFRCPRDSEIQPKIVKIWLLGSLGRSYGLLGRSWRTFWPNLGAFWPSWGVFGRSWTPSWGVFGRSWAVLGAPGGAQVILSHPRLGPFTMFKESKVE